MSKIEELSIYLEGNNNKWCFIITEFKPETIVIKEVFSGEVKDNKIDEEYVKLICCIEALKLFKNNIKLFKKKNILKIHTSSIYLKNLIDYWIEDWADDNFMIKNDIPRPNINKLKELNDLLVEIKNLKYKIYVYTLESKILKKLKEKNDS